MARKSPPLPGKNKKAPTEIGEESGIMLDGIISSDDYNAAMVGRAGIEVFDEMKLGDSTVNAVLLALQLPILSARWWVEPAAHNRNDRKVAQFVEDELFKRGTRTWQETLTEILDYLPYGRMPFEIVWEFRQLPDSEIPYIGVRKLSSRHPRTIYSWKMKDGNAGVTQYTVNGNYSIPMDRLVIFVNQKKGSNWEGQSILRSAYKHWYMKNKMYLIDAISAERQGLGVPMGTVPTGTEDGVRDKLEEILKNFRANDKGYIMIDEGMKVEILDMKGGLTKNLAPSIQHHDRAIALNVLAQFLQLGSSSVGSFALSSDQSKLFILSLESVANYVRDTLNRYLVKKLVDYNFNVVEYPKLAFEKIGNVDHNILTTSLQRAMQAGIYVPQPEDEEYLRDIMDLPEKSAATAIQLDMFDDSFAELDAAVMDMTMLIDGDATAVAPEPTPEDIAQVADDAWNMNKTQFERKYGSGSDGYFDFIITAGRPGEPLSDETKKKISEALKKYHNSSGKGKKGKKGRKKTNPEITSKRKEAAGLRKDVRSLNTEYRKKLLEMKSKGVKLSEQDSAKMQLELLEAKSKLLDRIDQLKTEITEIKEREAAAAEVNNTPEPDNTASDVGRTLDRINALIDGHEK